MAKYSNCFWFGTESADLAIGCKSICLVKQFRKLPPEARRQIGPLFWLHGDESKERLEIYVGKVAEGGNGDFTPS
jgi:hypothetical protein